MPNRVGGEPQEQSMTSQIIDEIKAITGLKNLKFVSFNFPIMTLSGVLTPQPTFREQLKDEFGRQGWSW